MDKYCMCEKLGLLARDGKSTCMQCGGIDAYGSRNRRNVPGVDMLIQVEEIAKEAHKGQKRWSGAEYWTHPAAVALSFPDDAYDYKIVAWLHDVLEDTEYTPTMLLDLGIPEHLVGAVMGMTKREGQNYYDFIIQVSKNKIATVVKIADINHNMSDLKEGSLKDKYRLAKHVLETFIKQDLL